MWLITEYRPVSLFSLRSGLATSTGAKTLFVPTPFAIRTAMLDAAIRTQGIGVGQPVFNALKAAALAIRPPDQVAVTNLFAKIQKPARKDKPKKGEVEDETDSEDEQGKAMTRTIAFREYAHLWGNIGIAFGGDDVLLSTIKALLPQVNYFGKRGSFFQLLDVPHESQELPADYRLLDGMGLPSEGMPQLPAAIPLGVIQVMDDWGESLTFAKVNIYSDEKITLGKDRVRKNVVLPYRLVRSSKGYSLYERIP